MEVKGFGPGIAGFYGFLDDGQGKSTGFSGVVVRGLES